MNQSEAEKLVNWAIDQIVRHDFDLLNLDVTERSLSHKLAHYMELSGIVQPPLTVDCEYNRHFNDPKRLRLRRRKAKDRELRATTVFPDIVVHERNSDANNLLVLEMKKPGEDMAYDSEKLYAFQSELGYIHAGHVILGLDESENLIRKVIWIA